MPPGDTLYVLDYLGEGHYRVWYEGTVLTTYEFWDRPELEDRWRRPDAEGTMTVEPRTRWWVRVRTPAGERGWIEMKEGVRVRGHDACG